MWVGRWAAGVLLASGALTACSDDDPFAPVATQPNTVRGFSVSTFTGTDGALPAAIDFLNVRTVRPEVSPLGTVNFQLAIDLDAQGRLLLQPARSVVLPPGGTSALGLLKSPSSFETVEAAPTGGFVSDTAVVAQVGEAWLIRIDGSGCPFGDPWYAKLVVDAVDAPARRVGLRVMVNRNCGFRGLTEGLPRN